MPLTVNGSDYELDGVKLSQYKCVHKTPKDTFEIIPTCNVISGADEIITVGDVDIRLGNQYSSAKVRDEDTWDIIDDYIQHLKYASKDKKKSARDFRILLDLCEIISDIDDNVIQTYASLAPRTKEGLLKPMAKVVLWESDSLSDGSRYILQEAVWAGQYKEEPRYVVVGFSRKNK